MLIEPGPHRYPTPWGELHADRRFDEITLVRLIDAMRDCGLTPRLVLAAVVTDARITFDYQDDPPQFDDGDPAGPRLVTHTITTLSRP